MYTGMLDFPLVAVFDSQKKASNYAFIGFARFFFHFGLCFPIKNKLEQVSSHEAFL